MNNPYVTLFLFRITEDMETTLMDLGLTTTVLDNTIMALVLMAIPITIPIRTHTISHISPAPATTTTVREEDTATPIIKIPELKTAVRV